MEGEWVSVSRLINFSFIFFPFFFFILPDYRCQPCFPVIKPEEVRLDWTGGSGFFDSCVDDVCRFVDSRGRWKSIGSKWINAKVSINALNNFYDRSIGSIRGVNGLALINL